MATATQPFPTPDRRLTGAWNKANHQAQAQSFDQDPTFLPEPGVKSLLYGLLMTASR